MSAHDHHPIVVVGFDGSPASHVALSRAIHRVGDTGKLYVVHAWHTPEAWRGRGTYQPNLDRALDAAEATIDAAKEAHPALSGITWESELIGGPPARSIADVAKIRGADEIVIGTRGFGRMRALLGSVAHELIHLADCPVTVIPERLVDRQNNLATDEHADAAAQLDAGLRRPRFAGHGKPLMLGETFAIDRVTEEAFLLSSRRWLDGTLSFYDGRAPADVMARPPLVDAMYLQNLISYLGLRTTLRAAERR